MIFCAQKLMVDQHLFSIGNHFNVLPSLPLRKALLLIVTPMQILGPDWSIQSTRLLDLHGATIVQSFPVRTYGLFAVIVTCYQSLQNEQCDYMSFPTTVFQKLIELQFAKANFSFQCHSMKHEIDSMRSIAVNGDTCSLRVPIQICILLCKASATKLMSYKLLILILTHLDNMSTDYSMKFDNEIGLLIQCVTLTVALLSAGVYDRVVHLLDTLIEKSVSFQYRVLMKAVISKRAIAFTKEINNMSIQPHMRSTMLKADYTTSTVWQDLLVAATHLDKWSIYYSRRSLRCDNEIELLIQYAISTCALFTACFWNATKPPDFSYGHEQCCIILQSALRMRYCSLSRPSLVNVELFCYWAFVVHVHVLRKGYLTLVLVYTAFEPPSVSSQPLCSLKKLGVLVVTLTKHHIVIPVMRSSNFFALWNVMFIVEWFLLKIMEDNFHQRGTIVVLRSWSNLFMVAYVHNDYLPCHHNGLHIHTLEKIFHHELRISKTKVKLINHGFPCKDFLISMVEIPPEQFYEPMVPKIWPTEVAVLYVCLLFLGLDDINLRLCTSPLDCDIGLLKITSSVLHSGFVSFWIIMLISIRVLCFQVAVVPLGGRSTYVMTYVVLLVKRMVAPNALCIGMKPATITEHKTLLVDVSYPFWATGRLVKEAWIRFSSTAVPRPEDMPSLKGGGMLGPY